MTNQLTIGAAPSGSRILCISPFFPPVANSESFCGGKLVSTLLAAGFDISVLYSSNINGPNNTEDRSSLWSSLRSVSTDVVIPKDKNQMRSLFQAARYRTHVYVRWINAVLQVASQLHAQRKFDLIYSRSLPTVAHWAGYWCAKKLKLPWIANVNDPWDVFLSPGRNDVKQVSLYAATSSYWYRKMIKTADLVIYPTDRLHHYHKKIFKIDGPTAIIPHLGCASPTVMEGLSEPPLSGFRLVHAGKLGSNEKPCRSPNALLIGLHQFLSDHPDTRSLTKLTLVGLRDRETEKLVESLGLQANVDFIGSVSYEDSLKYIASASVCVLVEAELEEGIFLPSKLVDYISARKPVLALSPRNGVIADLADQRRIVRVDPGAPDGVKAAITSFYADFRAGVLNNRTLGDDLSRRYSSQSIVPGFFQALSRVKDRQNASPCPLPLRSSTA